MLKLKEKQEEFEEEEDEGFDDENFAERLLKKVRKFAKSAWKNWKLVLVCAAVIVVAVAVIAVTVSLNRKDEVVEEVPIEPEIEVSSALTEIVGKSRLSTFLAVYDGIVTVKDEKGNVKYHVAYESVVKTGIDISQVQFTVDEADKIIHIVVPEAKINEINVDHKSLDFMFQNEKYNTPEVVAEAYGLCENDADTECNDQEAIFELAKQNAGNVLKAIVKPIVEQIDAEYSVVID